MRSSPVAKSLSATATATSTVTSGDPQFGMDAGQHPRGSYMGLSTTAHTPGSTQIPATHQQHSGVRLLSEASTTQLQVDPFEALATHQTVTFDDQYQEQSYDSPSPSNQSSRPVESSEPVVRAEPYQSSLFIVPIKDGGDTKIRTMTSIPKHQIMPSINDHFRRALSGTVPKVLLSTIAKDPKLLTGAYVATPKTDTTTDKWIIWAGDKERPFKCGYQGCDKRFTRKQSLQTHLVRHTGTSRFRCYLGACNGEVAFSSYHTLRRHTFKEHGSVRPFQCEICDKQYVRKDFWKSHRKHVHAIEDEKKSPRRKGK